MFLHSIWAALTSWPALVLYAILYGLLGWYVNTIFEGMFGHRESSWPDFPGYQESKNSNSIIPNSTIPTTTLFDDDDHHA